MLRKIFTLIIILVTLNTYSQTLLDTAPDFSGKDIHGNMRYLWPTLDSNYFVLLDFFTTTCGPCVTYAPDIQQAYVHFGSNQGNIRFWGINFADDNNGVAYFDSLYGIEFPTISGLDGHGNTIALDIMQVQSFPTMVLVAPNRVILNHQIFPPDFHNLDSTITSSIGHYTSQNESAGDKAPFSIVSIFPNPSMSNLQMLIVASRPQRVTFEILSLNGDVVREIENCSIKEGQQSFSFDTSGIQPGIYFVRAMCDTGIVRHEKFIVK
jgi:thiol-disulfide isomerase/thioredoxin